MLEDALGCGCFGDFCGANFAFLFSMQVRVSRFERTTNLLQCGAPNFIQSRCKCHRKCRNMFVSWFWVLRVERLSTCMSGIFEVECRYICQIEHYNKSQLEYRMPEYLAKEILYQDVCWKAYQTGCGDMPDVQSKHGCQNMCRAECPSKCQIPRMGEHTPVERQNKCKRELYVLDL